MQRFFLVLSIAAVSPRLPPPGEADRALHERYVRQTQAYIRAENARKGGEFRKVDPDDLRAIVDEFSKQGVDPAIGLALAAQESRFEPGAVSRRGARGLFQFMPGTAEDWDVNPSDARSSARGAARFLEHLRLSSRYRAHCAGDLRCALYHYYTGPNRRKGLRAGLRYAAEVIRRARRINAAPAS